MNRWICSLTILAAIGATHPAAAQVPPLQEFSSGGIQGQGIVPSTSGRYFIVVNTNGKILSIPAVGGPPALLTTIPIPPATACTPSVTPCLSLRDGAFLPDTFGPLAGKFLVVGGVATTNTPAFASIVNDSYQVTPYATQASSLWSAAVVAGGFGQYTGGVLVVNQGSGQSLKNGGVDFFAPDGTVQLLAALPEAEVPYGAAIAPAGFGDIAGNLLVSDARSGRIYSVNPAGKVRLFTTIPLAATQSGLRQVAFAPQGWGKYSRHLFVSIVSGEVAVVDRKGEVVAKIGGIPSPRSIRFTEVDGAAALLIADTATQRILRAGPEHLVPVQ